MDFSFNMKKTEIILKIIDNDVVDFFERIYLKKSCILD
jgi:hypothetical protein